jgi:hypothetical protein
MVRISIDRKMNPDGSYVHDADGIHYLYDIVRQTKDNKVIPIVNENDAPWDRPAFYRFMQDEVCKHNLPVDLGEGVMHDFNDYADEIEAREHKESHERRKAICGKGQKLTPEQLEEMLSKPYPLPERKSSAS